MFGAAVCKIQASKRWVESLPLVLKDERSCFSQGERSTVQLPLDRALALRKQDAATDGKLGEGLGTRLNWSNR